MALINKWKLSILNEKDMVWSSVLKRIYKNQELKVLIGEKSVLTNRDSIWWRDLLLSDNYVNLQDNHFTSATTCRPGNGVNIPFWYTQLDWRSRFEGSVSQDPIICCTPHNKCDECGLLAEAVLVLEFSRFGRKPKQHRSEWWQDFTEHVQAATLFADGADNFKCKREPNGNFTVNSCIKLFSEKVTGPPLPAEKVSAINLLGKMKFCLSCTFSDEE